MSRMDQYVEAAGTGAEESRGAAGPTVRDTAGVLRRRLPLIVAALILTPLIAVVVSLGKTTQYAASSDVLIGGTDYAALVNGIAPGATDPERTASTLASLARVPDVARRVLVKTGLGGTRTVQEFLAQSSVSPTTGADILRFTVSDRDAATAKELATAYADVFTQFRQDIDSRSIDQARAGLDAELARLAASGAKKSATYADLEAKKRQLLALEALQTNSTVVVQPAVEAGKTGPQPVRNGVLGLALGVILAIGLAYLAESLDTRVRSAEDLERRLGASVLGRIPLPGGGTHFLPMLTHPNGPDAEAFRMLRTSFDFVNLNHEARSVLVTSSVGEEGKSVTSANLAIALARAQRRVILCDLDARKPSIATMFGLDGRSGITDVALGTDELEDALVPIPLTPASDAGRPTGSGAEPLLRVLTLGTTRPPAPGEFVGSAHVPGDRRPAGRDGRRGGHRRAAAARRR